jgi:hypothetical protein
MPSAIEAGSAAERRLLDALRAGAAVTHACNVAGCSRQTYYEELKRPEFAAAVEEAQSAFIVRAQALISQAALTDWRAAAEALKQHRALEGSGSKGGPVRVELSEEDQELQVVQVMQYVITKTARETVRLLTGGRERPADQLSKADRYIMATVAGLMRTGVLPEPKVVIEQAAVMEQEADALIASAHRVEPEPEPVPTEKDDPTENEEWLAEKLPANIVKLPAASIAAEDATMEVIAELGKLGITVSSPANGRCELSHPEPSADLAKQVDRIVLEARRDRRWRAKGW